MFCMVMNAPNMGSNISMGSFHIGSVLCISTFYSFLFIKPPTHCFPGSHRQLVAHSFERHCGFLAQSPRRSNLHRIALAAQGRIGFGQIGFAAASRNPASTSRSALSSAASQPQAVVAAPGLVALRSLRRS